MNNQKIKTVLKFFYDLTKSEVDMGDDSLYAVYSILDACVNDESDVDINKALEEILKELDIKIEIDSKISVEESS